jgi:hypothetical protein
METTETGIRLVTTLGGRAPLLLLMTAIDHHADKRGCAGKVKVWFTFEGSS